MFLCKDSEHSTERGKVEFRHFFNEFLSKRSTSNVNATSGERGKGHIRQAKDEHQNHGQKECNLAVSTHWCVLIKQRGSMLYTPSEIAESISEAMLLSTIKQQVRVTTSTLSLEPRESTGSIATNAGDSTYYMEYFHGPSGLTRSVTRDNADTLAWTIGKLMETSSGN